MDFFKPLAGLSAARNSMVYENETEVKAGKGDEEALMPAGVAT